MKKTCLMCRYWSEMIAKVVGSEMYALCLEPTQPQEMTSEKHTCSAWRFSEHGSIDDPVHKGVDPYAAEAAP